MYNEQVRDLLNPESRTKLIVRDNGGKPLVPGLKMVSAKTAEQVLDLLTEGNKWRAQNATEVNSQSSRSHAVFTIRVKMSQLKSGMTSKMQLGKLDLVDLAGSERATASANWGKARIKEGVNINKSLLALGEFHRWMVESHPEF